MAITYHFDLYPRDDPKDGARLVRFTQLQSAEYRGEANGTGAGRISLRGSSVDAGYIDPAGLQYVRVVRDDGSTEAVVGGFFLDNGDYAALTSTGNELLTFGGAGTLAYLERAVMAPHTYISPIFTGQDPFDDTWRLYAQSTVYANGNYLGAMLWRVIYEAQHFTPGSHRHADGVTVTDTHDDDRLENALPALTMGFDAFDDSDAAAWTVTSGEFKAMVGENVISVVKRLMEAGLYVWMDPDTFELNAWEAATHGRARTGSSWGSSVVRFQAPIGGDIDTGNIKSDAKRGIQAYVKRSAIWAGGQDVFGFSTTGGSDIPWEGFYPSDVVDVDALEYVATTQLGARSDAGDTVRLRMKLGADPTNGRYLPFEHVQLDDRVTLHTGSGQWDWDEQTFPVAALTVLLRQGGDWDALVDLGSSYSSIAERRFQVAGVPTHTHLPNPQLCQPGTLAGEGTDVALWDFTTNANDTTNTYASGLNRMTGGDYAVAEAVLDGPWGQTGPGGSSTDRVPITAGVGYTFSADHVYQYLPSDRDIYIEFWSAGSLGTLVQSILWQAGVGHSIGVKYSPSDSYTAPVGATHVCFRFDNVADHHIDNLRIATSGAAGTGGDGHPDLVGTSNRATRCDHRHHLLRDYGPSVDDDASAGIPETTLWTDTVSGQTWVSVDDTDGAAVWQFVGVYDAELLKTSETDTSFVLRPDGVGGVEWAHGGTAGSGTVTPPAGAGTSLITSGGYVAFPVLARAANGDLLLFYRRGTDHNVTNDGVAYVRRSTDDGATWGSEATVWSNPGWSVAVEGVTVRRNGDIVVVASAGDGPALTDNFFAYTITSTDDGATWGTPDAFGTVYGTGSEDREVATGIVELPDGNLLASLFVRLNADTADKIVSFISTDDGATWGSEATIADDSDSWSESRLAVLDDGTVLAMLRNDTDKDIYTSRSTDGGATWSTPALAFAGWGFPRFRRLNSGAIAIIYRQDDGSSDGRAVYRVSYDGAVTWSAEANLETSGLDMQYGDLIAIPGSTTVRAAYSIENSSTDADIYVTTLTDIGDVRYGTAPLLTVTEEDGAPIAHAVRELRFPADSVTVNGDGSVSISTGAPTTHWEPVIFDNGGTPELVYFQDASGVWDIVMQEVAN